MLKVVYATINCSLYTKHIIIMYTMLSTSNVHDRSNSTTVNSSQYSLQYRVIFRTWSNTTMLYERIDDMKLKEAACGDREFMLFKVHFKEQCKFVRVILVFPLV